MVIKNIENKTYWSEWNDKYKELDKDAMEQIAQMKHDEIEEIKVLQYLFFKQWKDFKTYANNKGIKLIGDIPIYISYSSADVWTHQNLFKLDHQGKNGLPVRLSSRSFYGIGTTLGTSYL